MRLLVLMLPVVSLLRPAMAWGAEAPRIGVEVVGSRSRAIRSAIERGLPKGVEVAEGEGFELALDDHGVAPEQLAETLARKGGRRKLGKRVRRAIADEGIAAALLATLRRSPRGAQLLLVVFDADGVVLVHTAIPYPNDKKLTAALRRELAFLAEALVEAEEEPQPKAIAEPAPKRTPKRRPKHPTKPAAASEEAGDHVVWLGASIVQEVTFAAGEDLCTKESQLNDAFICFREQGSQYHGTPLDPPSLALSPALANTRVLVAVEIPAGSWLAVGGRVGYSLRGGPTPDGGNAFIPFYGEGRLSLYFAGEPLTTEDASGFVFAAGGVAQLDAAFGVEVEEDPDAPRPRSQLDNPPRQELDVWKKSGPGFLGLGLGTFLPTGSFHGVLLELKGMVLFPELGGGLGLGAGYLFGI